MKRLVILDFDGTIYQGDSMRDFAKFLNPLRYYYSLFLISIPYLLSCCRLIHRNNIKKIFLFINFRNYSPQLLTEQGELFFQEFRAKLLPSFLTYFKKNKDQGAFVILSGSCKEWLLPFADELNIPLIATKLRYRNNKSTGSWRGENLVGKEKKKAIERFYSLSDYDEIIAFGDTNSDRELEPICTTFHFRYFQAN
jgi:HAD superfamily phosphoserine phosphatase-like hydrolase